MTQDQLEYSLQFQHPEKVLGLMPGITDSIIAEMFKLDLDIWSQIRAVFKENARQTAVELLEDDLFAEQVRNLPFKTDDRIVVLGDSISDDLQSWFEILRNVCEIHIPERKLTFINLAISGDTTTHMISRFLEVIMAKPDWIFCFAGANDARLQGTHPTKVLVSPEETEKNFKMLRNFAKTQTDAEWVWMTTATVIEEVISSHWFLGVLQLMWLNKDLNVVSDIVRKQDGAIVELQQVFGNPARSELLLDDGIHPSLAGQKEIVKAVVGTCLTV